MQKFKKKQNTGFTLIEILLVLALLGLVVSMFGGKLFSAFDKGNVQATRIQIKQLEGALDRFRLDCNSYPTSDQGLKALVDASAAGEGCKNYSPDGYLGGKKQVPLDAWKNEFIYTCTDGQNYVIKSLGSDKLEGGEANAKDILSSDE